jgi:hypothetical protein
MPPRPVTGIAFFTFILAFIAGLADANFILIVIMKFRWDLTFKVRVAVKPLILIFGRCSLKISYTSHSD